MRLRLIRGLRCMFLRTEKMDQQTFVDSQGKKELLSLIALARERLEMLEDEEEESSSQPSDESGEELVEILSDEKEGISCRTFESSVIHTDHKGDDSGWTESGNHYFAVFDVSRVVVEISIDYYTRLSMYDNELHTKTTIRVVDGDKELVREYSNLWLLDYESHEWEPNYERRTEGGFVDNDDPLNLSDMGEYRSIVEKCTNLIREHRGELDIGYE